MVAFRKASPNKNSKSSCCTRQQSVEEETDEFDDMDDKELDDLVEYLQDDDQSHDLDLGFKFLNDRKSVQSSSVKDDGNGAREGK